MTSTRPLPVAFPAGATCNNLGPERPRHAVRTKVPRLLKMARPYSVSPTLRAGLLRRVDGGDAGCRRTPRREAGRVVRRRGVQYDELPVAASRSAETAQTGGTHRAVAAAAVAHRSAETTAGERAGAALERTRAGAGGCDATAFSGWRRARLPRCILISTGAESTGRSETSTVGGWNSLIAGAIAWSELTGMALGGGWGLLSGRIAGHRALLHGRLLLLLHECLLSLLDRYLLALAGLLLRPDRAPGAERECCGRNDRGLLNRVHGALHGVCSRPPACHPHVSNAHSVPDRPKREFLKRIHVITDSYVD